MLTYIYEWIQNIAFYMVLVTAVIHMLPNSEYKKYIRFFTGLVLILLLLSPILKLLDNRTLFTDIYEGGDYKKQLKQMEQAAGEAGDKSGDEADKKIEVGEIKVEVKGDKTGGMEAAGEPGS